MDALAILIILVFAIPLAFGIICILEFIGLTIFGDIVCAIRDIRHKPPKE